ncbi:PHD finger protein ING2-like protein [Drosera capensis]
MNEQRLCADGIHLLLLLFRYKLQIPPGKKNHQSDQTLAVPLAQSQTPTLTDSPRNPHNPIHHPFHGDCENRHASTLPAELQRLLNTIRELDERSLNMINQTRHQTKYCLGMSSHGSRKGNCEDDEDVFD